jgi:metal-responsive CopG/Arc/MetJ family transcriptional regulator
MGTENTQESIKISISQDWDLWHEFRRVYRERGSDRNEAIEEAIEIYNQKNKNLNNSKRNRLINSTATIIISVWNEFKQILKGRGHKKNEAMSEAITLYIERYKNGQTV